MLASLEREVCVWHWHCFSINVCCVNQRYLMISFYTTSQSRVFNLNSRPWFQRFPDSHCWSEWKKTLGHLNHNCTCFHAELFLSLVYIRCTRFCSDRYLSAQAFKGQITESCKLCRFYSAGFIFCLMLLQKKKPSNTITERLVILLKQVHLSCAVKVH